MPTLTNAQVKSITRALPFWLSLCGPVVVIAATLASGAALILPPLLAWWMFSALDALIGEDPHNADPNTPDAD